VDEVVNVLAIFPACHALVLMPASMPVAYPVGVTDEEAADLVLGAEVDNLPAGLVAQVANASLGSAAVLVHGALQLPPSTGVLRTGRRVFPHRFDNFIEASDCREPLHKPSGEQSVLAAKA
jgi:hypothetical protein